MSRGAVRFCINRRQSYVRLPAPRRRGRAAGDDRFRLSAVPRRCTMATPQRDRRSRREAPLPDGLRDAVGRADRPAGERSNGSLGRPATLTLSTLLGLASTSYDSNSRFHRRSRLFERRLHVGGTDSAGAQPTTPVTNCSCCTSASRGTSMPDAVAADARSGCSAHFGVAPAIVFPNYVWELCSTGFAPDVQCIGMCHADSEEQYYHPLTWYESLISHFIGVSPECHENLRRRFAFRGDEISLLPYGIPVSPALKRDYQVAPIRIVYAGRVTQLQKRVWDFIPFVQQLKAAGVDFTLLTSLARGDQRSALQEAAGVALSRRMRSIPRASSPPRDGGDLAVARRFCANLGFRGDERQHARGDG